MGLLPLSWMIIGCFGFALLFAVRGKGVMQEKLLDAALMSVGLGLSALALFMLLVTR